MLLDIRAKRERKHNGRINLNRRTKQVDDTKPFVKSKFNAPGSAMGAIGVAPMPSIVKTRPRMT